MGLSCVGSQNYGYCSQAAYDPKHSQEKTTRLLAQSHYRLQMCVHAWIAEWRLEVCKNPLGFQLILVGKHSLLLFPGSLPPYENLKADGHHGFKMRLPVQRTDFKSQLCCVPSGRTLGLSEGNCCNS